MKLPLIKRLAERIDFDAPNGCHEWTGGLTGGGYGSIGGHGKVHLVHRLTYQMVHGAIPDEHDIDHLCRNRRCCNPDHLEAVTRSENLRRGFTITSLHAAKTHCPQGHAYTGKNNRGERICRTCIREHDRAYRARKAAA